MWNGRDIHSKSIRMFPSHVPSHRLSAGSIFGDMEKSYEEGEAEEA